MESSIYNGNLLNFAIQSNFDHSTWNFHWIVTMSKTGKMFKTKPKTKAKPTTSNTSDQVKKNTVFVQLFLSSMDLLNLFELNQKKKSSKQFGECSDFADFHSNLNTKTLMGLFWIKLWSNIVCQHIPNDDQRLSYTHRIIAEQCFGEHDFHHVNIPYLFLSVPSQVIITFYWFRQQKSSDYTQFVEWLLISYHIKSWLHSNLVILFRNYFAIACCVSCERKCEFLKYFQIRLTVCWGKNGATLLWVDILFGKIETMRLN